MPMFLPTHYTVHETLFWNSEGDISPKKRQANEAVMLVETAKSNPSRFKVLDGDGRFAWLDANEIYTGPRR